MSEKHEKYEFIYMQQTSITGQLSSATVKLLVNGEKKTMAATGDGAVDAIFNALKKAAGVDYEMQAFAFEGIGTSSKAVAKVVVRLKNGHRIKHGQGEHLDTLHAWAFAFVDGFNQFEKQKTDAVDKYQITESGRARV